MEQRAWLGVVLTAVLAVSSCQAPVAATAPPTPDPSAAHAALADHLRSLEAVRHAALVDGKVELVRPTLADDFQLIDPGGDATSKDDYLDEVATRAVDYLSWDIISPIEVRLFEGAAILRYRSRIVVTLGGAPVTGEFWQTDVYELRGGDWLVTWAQTTQISS
jgi:hypothetical protein